MEFIWVLLGVTIGMAISIIMVLTLHVVGTLRVDQSDPSEPPYLFLELKKPISKFCRKAYVILEVKIKNYISQD